MTRRSHVLFVSVITAFLLGGGCAHRPPVQPWQKEHLARRSMRFDAERGEMRFCQHLYTSREASDGGYGEPGGGCGCN